MNSLFTLVYIMMKNYCVFTMCDCCDHAELAGYRVLRCTLKRGLCSMIDNICGIMKKNYSYPNKNPIWDILLKECNTHYRYGRFDCCKHCKFYTAGRCIFSKIWDKL